MTTLPSDQPQGNVTPIARAADPIDPRVHVGHVHLRTADIDRVKTFYVGVLGFDVIQEARGIPGWGTTGDVLFLSAGGYHHHLGFNTWKSAGGPPTPDGHAGLHHVAFNYPTRAALGDAVRRLRAADWPLRQVADHGTHLAIYVTDPDGNDVELVWDRPQDQWPRDGDGHVQMAMDGGVDLDGLVAEAAAASPEASPQAAPAAAGRLVSFADGSAPIAGDTAVFELFVKTTPQRLWAAITDPAQRARYSFGAAVHSDWTAGSPYTSTAGGGAFEIARGTNLEVEPPRRLVQTFEARWSEAVIAQGATRVSWEIEPVGTSCRLTVIHDELPAGADPQLYGGWPMILSGLKTWLETGEPLDTPGSLLHGG